MAQEDLTTWTENDPNAKLTVTSSRVTVTNGDRDEEYGISDDWSPAAGMSVDGELYINSSSSNVYYWWPWMQHNKTAAGNWTWWDLVGDGSEVVIGVRIGSSGGSPFARMIRRDSGSQANSADISLSEDTLYYWTFEDDGPGTNWKLSIYSDSARTTHVTGSPKTLSQSTVNVADMTCAGTLIAHDSGTSGEDHDGYVQGVDMGRTVTPTGHAGPLVNSIRLKSKVGGGLVA